MRHWVLFAIACGLLLGAASAAVALHQDRATATRDKWTRHIELKYSWLRSAEGRAHRREVGFHEPWSPPAFPYFKSDLWMFGVGAVCLVLGVFAAVGSWWLAGPQRSRTRLAFGLVLVLLVVLEVGVDCLVSSEQQQYDLRFVEDQLTTEGSNLLHDDPLVALQNLDRWRGTIESTGPWISETRKRSVLERIDHLTATRRKELKRQGWSEEDLRLLD